MTIEARRIGRVAHAVPDGPGLPNAASAFSFTLQPFSKRVVRRKVKVSRQSSRANAADPRDSSADIHTGTGIASDRVFGSWHGVRRKVTTDYDKAGIWDVPGTALNLNRPDSVVRTVG